MSDVFTVFTRMSKHTQKVILHDKVLLINYDRALLAVLAILLVTLINMHIISITGAIV